MMDSRGDACLLGAWRREGDRAAMDELVRRYINLVYGTARRITRDPVGAEDITQAVFMLLIQKSPRIENDLALAAWLHRTTRFACSNAMQMAARRGARERRAARSESIDLTTVAQVDSNDERHHLLAVLDDAINSLRSRDRRALLTFYFQQRSYREIGDSIG